MDKPSPVLFKGQILHFGFLLIAVLALLFGIRPGPAAWQGLEVATWFHLALAIPIIHQI